MITFDYCPSGDSESDSADSAAADIPAIDSNHIEPDLSSEGEVEDSRAPAAIVPEHAPEAESSEDDGPDLAVLMFERPERGRQKGSIAA